MANNWMGGGVANWNGQDPNSWAGSQAYNAYGGGIPQMSGSVMDPTAMAENGGCGGVGAGCMGGGCAAGGCAVNGCTPGGTNGYNNGYAAGCVGGAGTYGGQERTYTGGINGYGGDALNGGKGCNGYESGYGGYNNKYSQQDDYDDDAYYPKYNQGQGPMYSQDVIGASQAGAVSVTITGKSGAAVPDSMGTFEACETVFPPVIMNSMRNAGFTEPMPIQAHTWQLAIQGRDVIGVAKTGSGKTLAFLLPGFLKIMNQPNGLGRQIRILAMAPTRELAKQIESEAQKFGSPCRINTACLYGGAPRRDQLMQLRRGVQVVVATPGRLNDFIDYGQADLSACGYIVLDEADRMLDMGFEPQIRTILARVSTPRQTLMFTATWGKEVRSLASDFLIDPYSVTLGQEKLTANSDVSQFVIICRDDQEKLEELRNILAKCSQGDLVLIFCDTKAGCARLGEHLYSSYRVPCTALHGDLDQSARDRAIQNFRSGKRPIMVGTDVAARGLDIKGIKVVVNFDPASDGEDYVHRIGRTGRAGEKGFAYSLLTPKNAKKARDIVKVMQAGNIPIPQDLADLAGTGSGRSGGKGKGGKGKGKRRGPGGYGKGYGGGGGKGKGSKGFS